MLDCNTFGSRSPVSRNGKRMFSSTVIESKSAAPWNRIPTFLRMAPSCRSLMPIMFSPWIQISPESGSIKPIIFFSKTLFPPPLRPIRTRVSPVRTSRSTRALRISFPFAAAALVCSNWRAGRSSPAEWATAISRALWWMLPSLRSPANFATRPTSQWTP